MAATIDVSTNQTVTFDASLDDVWALLSDPKKSAQSLPDLTSIEDLGDDRYQYRFKAIGFKSISFEPHYTAKYTMDAKSIIEWKAEPDGNLRQNGSWSLEAKGDQTIGKLEIKAQADLPMPKLLKGAATPFFKDQFNKTIADWINGLKRAL